MDSKTPLEGIKILDLSSLYAGPLIATNLGDFGAEVIKVEHPIGDEGRRWGKSKNGVPLWWKVISRNKRLISLDLHNETDRESVRKLCEWADVLIENFRPGKMESWGLGYDVLQKINPRIIMVRVTGYGQYGPNSSLPGFGTLAESFSGFAYITGQPEGPPTLPPFGLADGVAALVGTYATMMALYWRDVKGGGVGQVIDLSLYEPLFNILGPQAIEFTQLGTKQERTGNRSPRTSPRNTYKTSDGHWVAISAGTQQIANRIFEAIEKPEFKDDSRFSKSEARKVNADLVEKFVSDWIAAHPLKKVLQRFKEVEAPLAPIYSIEQILEDPHYQCRESFITVDDEDLGQVVMQNVVPKLSLTPGRIRFTGKTTIGADNDYILKQILKMPSYADEDGSKK